MATPDPGAPRCDADGLTATLSRAWGAEPEIAARSKRELSLSLAGIRSSRLGSIAWSSSCLTPSRSPIEFAVTSTSKELRTVVDVLAPEDDRRFALDRALTLATRFGSARIPFYDRLQAHQRTFAVRFGAWLGSRHHRDRTSHKLYIELSPDSRSVWRLLDDLYPEARHFVGGLGRIPFLGLHLDGSDAVEMYVRPQSFGPDHLRICASRTGMPPEHVEGLIDAMHNGSWRPPLGPNHGFSVAICNHEAVALAGFSFARRELGVDSSVRSRLLTTMATNDWPSRDLYAALTAPLANRRPMTRPVHSALAHIASIGSARFESHITLSPPPDSVSTR